MEYYEHTMNMIRERFRLLGGGDIDSQSDIEKLLFGVLELPQDGLSRKKDGHISLTIAAFEKLSQYHTIIGDIAEYRRLKALIKKKNISLDNPPIGKGGEDETPPQKIEGDREVKQLIMSEKNRLFFLIAIVLITLILYVYFEHSYAENFVDTLAY